MEILRTILLYTEGKDMPFLVIGGHAVNWYGISRHTADLDLVVEKSAKEKWLELFIKLSYSKNQDDDRFSRFHPDSVANWPIDLMYVDSETLSKMRQDSEVADFGGVFAPIVSARHLATL